MFEQEFESMLRKYGSIIDDKKKFTGLVKDFFPDQAKNINLLLMAYNMGIAGDLRNVGRINNTFAFRYVKQLMDDFGLSRVNADWIISVWCVCYGKNVLGKECEIKLQGSDAGPAIKEEKTSTKKYGDLFRYRQSQQGNGLGVCGFSGEKNQTIIFQNYSAGKPIIEICDNTFEGQGIEEAILTDGFAFIGKRAFADNLRLHQIVMPYSMKEIGDGAFENCTSLKSLTLPEQLERIGSGAFRNTALRTIKIPKTVYWFGEELFRDCKEIDNIQLPSNVDRITVGMFQGCENLKRITLPENLTEIEEHAFQDCRSLDILTIPDSVQKIGDTAFNNVHKLFIIQCSFGSYAETYARKHKIKYQLV